MSLQPSSVSRRDFVRRIGLAAGSVTLIASLPGGTASAQTPTAEPSPAEASQSGTRQRSGGGGEGGEGRREIPKWGEPIDKILNRESVVAAVADYLLQANFEGYHPDRRKVLAVRKSDRIAVLRDAGTPVRQESYYIIEGELFTKPGLTKLKPGATPESQAAELVEAVWDPFYIWVAYDLARSSSAGFYKPFKSS